MNSEINLEKLERFNKGLSKAEEIEYIHNLFSENESNPEFKLQIQKYFDEYLKDNQDENHNLSYLLDHIHHVIHKTESREKDKIINRVYTWYSTAAAILLIPILVASVFWFEMRNQGEKANAETSVKSMLFAPLGSRISFSLPDGTKGWLNSGSSLEYQIPFNNRKIAVSGEAWFDVSHDKINPFEISAGNSKVKVLGTKFNLNAYPQEDHIEVVLEEGKVEFSVPELSSAIEMKPNERLTFSKGKVNIEVTDASKFGAWKEGKLVFRSDPMTEVARRIERWYNVEVVFVDKELGKYIFRGIFQDDSLEEVLYGLCMTSPIRYRIIDPKLLEDGTIQKKKILLYKKNI